MTISCGYTYISDLNLFHDEFVVRYIVQYNDSEQLPWRLKCQIQEHGGSLADQRVLQGLNLAWKTLDQKKQ